MQGIGGALAEHKIPLFLNTKQAKKTIRNMKPTQALTLKKSNTIGCEIH